MLGLRKLLVTNGFEHLWRNRSTVARRRGRNLKKSHSLPAQDAMVKEMLDDELYHDRDFEFVQQGRMKSAKELFREDFEFKTINREAKKLANALYDDDEDDVKLAIAKRKLHDRNFLTSTHKKFEKETRNKEPQFEVPKKLKLEKKKARKLIPLPWDITEENRFDVLASIVIPRHHVPYEKQLRKKLDRCHDVMKSLGLKLRELKAPVRLGRSFLPCPLEMVRPSPRTEQYRNKDEFSVWPGIDGNPKTVGFFVGQPSLHDRVICVEPERIFITKSSHIEFARLFQRYLREVSPYDVCQNFGEGGNWRRVHIRSNEAGHHMLTAIMHPQELTQDEMREEMERLTSFFENNSQLRSLYFHASRHTRSTHLNEPYYHLSGDATLTESLFGKKFVISPSSFFQVNTAGAEVLYRAILTELGIESNDGWSRRKEESTTVLDLCCGTGVLACLIAHQRLDVKVIGIDSSQSAIEDAKRNAAENGATNIEFIHGNVEDALPQLAQDSYISGRVVAVANPSRRALHPSVIRTLRKLSFIEKVVYVSCKPEGDALRNFVDLGKPSQIGSSFVPVNAVPVDLFPHTNHCELVVTFERI